MRRIHEGEDGFSLPELLVTMSILAVVMALVTGSTIFLQRSINATDQRFDDLGQARLAMDATGKWLRAAITMDRTDTAEDTQPFTQAKRDRVDFLSNVRVTDGTGAPKRVRIEVVNGDELRERVWNGAIDANGQWAQVGGPTDRIIARGLTDPNLFTFFADDGTQLVPGGNGNLSEADREALRRVGIAITVAQEPTIDIPTSELRNQVVLPNQYYFDAMGQS